MTVKKLTASTPAAGAPFYTPTQTPPAGTALDTGTEVPTLFTPITLRGMTLQNRFAVSPMCMYSADDGHLTDWHLVHLGAFALRGAALTIVEATAVTANGRISPEDSGLWQDSQIAPLKRIVDFVHSQGQKIGIQLAHAGRKASTLGPWHVTPTRHEVATAEVGGWPDNLWAPSAIPWDEGYPTPHEMTVAQIEGLVQSFADAARRAVEAGVDTIEIHGAHGYLISEFLSPITNQRTDSYGGSFTNRTRLLVNTIRAVRAVIPSTMPLLLRISTTEWMEHTGQPSWDLAQSQQLAALLPDLGVDLLDVSSGGNNPAQQIKVHQYYQADLAGAIRAALRAKGEERLAIGAVGMVSTAEMARGLVQADGTLAGKENGEGTVEVDAEHGTKAKADLVLVARQFLREPEFVLKTATLLGVKVQGPVQYHRAPFKRERL
ncbi:hypothetical protein CHGG_01032 [Chaetomium globosum CBS 148.51]|uniref:NADH:flavin oxidoreductase/NADH oxidase N-terminal domain-containing protein n=1 Tax=Chaetomium globosum (strain ATCC 6205 / CBS 148.51 / DSM 1962 / NBRC 6347 / NRRL 1970) TaxID=306901 RepID=Q2HFH2_CHAGB|nr:uncharacterized protein CHGG_01032 [Chaetomium globosum CBS 148.51]EAQ92797.1 hypothetical protein CHGG_01032 [Chaetomium globosum CBS 148.51]